MQIRKLNDDKCHFAWPDAVMAAVDKSAPSAKDLELKSRPHEWDVRDSQRV